MTACRAPRLWIPPRLRPLYLTPGIVAAGGRRLDSFFGNVVSLLHFDGTNGSTTFTDEKGVTWTPAGNAQLSTTNAKFGTACLLLDGTGDWLEATLAAFAFGTGDFTIEAWSRWDSIVGNRFVFSWGGGWGAYSFSNSWATFNGATNLIVGGSAVINSYFHVAVTRAGTSMRMFTNGGLVGTGTDSTNFTNQTIRIGAQPSGSGAAQGRIDDFRVTAGVARYTAAFTAPTVPFPNG
jgi:hypothetical protein